MFLLSYLCTRVVYFRFERISDILFANSDTNTMTCISNFSLSGRGVIVMVFNATSSNISVISWRSVILVEETGVPQVIDKIICIEYTSPERNSNSQPWW